MTIDLAGCPARLLSPPADDLSRFEVPARGPAGDALAVALPATVDEVRALVSWAYQRRVALLPQGANTGLVHGSVPPPGRPMIVVSLDRMAGAIEVDPVGATATVGAGMRLSQLNEAAGRHGLHLPIDVSSDPSIGGMVATNTGGSRVVRYGPMRHHVLGVRAVTADAAASVVGSLAPIRKDSRGLDLAQVLIGSGGTLALVTDVTLALTPLPAQREVWWLALDDPDRMVDVFHALDLARPGALSAFEFVSALAFARTVAVDECPPNPFGDLLPDGAVLAEWSGDALVGIENDLAPLFEAGLIVDARLVPAGDAWALRHLLSTAQRRYGTVLAYDIAAPRTDLVAVRRWFIGALHERFAGAIEMADFGHVGDGGLHLNMTVPADLTASVDAAMADWLDDLSRQGRFTYSAEHGLGPKNAARWANSTSPSEQAAVAALKAAFDPRGILGHPDHPYNLLGPLDRPTD